MEVCSPSVRLRALCVLALGVFLCGCKKQAAGGPQQMPPPRVIAVPAVSQPVAETLSLVGDIAANESVEIRSEVDGVVLEIPFTEGQRIEKGQLLVRLDDSKFAAAVDEGEARFKLTESTYERSKQLFKDQLISQQEYDQSRSTFEVSRATLDLNKRFLRDAKIFAPFAGTVAARNISPGQVVTKNTPLTWIVDLDPVKIQFDVPEKFLSPVKLGQELAISVAAYPGRTFKGKVFFISPFIDTTNRTALVKAQAANPTGELKPGMFATLELTTTIRENAVVIPEVALTQILENNRAMVFVVDASTNAILRPVKLGVRMAGRVEVDGIKAGELVIVEGTQKTVPGKPVQLAPAADGAHYTNPGGAIIKKAE